MPCCAAPVPWSAGKNWCEAPCNARPRPTSAALTCTSAIFAKSWASRGGRDLILWRCAARVTYTRDSPEAQPPADVAVLQELGPAGGIAVVNADIALLRS